MTIQSIRSRLCCLMTQIISLLFISMMVCVFLEIVFRYLLKISVEWTEEGARYLFVWMVFLGAVVTFGEKKDTKLDILKKKVSNKISPYLEIFINTSVLVFSVIFFLGSLGMARLNWYVESLTLGWITEGYLYIPSIIGCFMIALFALANIIGSVGQLLSCSERA